MGNANSSHFIKYKEVKYRKADMSILLTGITASGKTTVFKQLKEQFGIVKPTELYFDAEKWRKVLISNLKNTIEKYQKKDIFNYGNDADVRKIEKEEEDLWLLTNSSREGCQKKLALSTNTRYLIGKTAQILQGQHQITKHDWLYAYEPTKTIVSAELLYSGNVWTVFDIGGDVDERRMWARHFERASVIVYVVALDEWDIRSTTPGTKTKY